jgi:hypothetical protein
MKSSGTMIAIAGNMRSWRIWNGNVRPPARKRAIPYAAKTPIRMASSVPKPAAMALFSM